MPRSTDRLLFLPRVVLSLLLLSGTLAPWVLIGLLLHTIFLLHRFEGPYNGGSDRMGLLILTCITLTQWLPPGIWQEAAFGYLAVQVVLSYFISGQVKLANPEWRQGRALRDVFMFSAYPVSKDLRSLADRPRLLLAASWAVILFELVFPLAFLSQPLLISALITAALFHLANACLFGLNRFLWIWIASYPSLLWLQARVIQF